jgi:hypothetical protein
VCLSKWICLSLLASICVCLQALVEPGTKKWFGLRLLGVKALIAPRRLLAMLIVYRSILLGVVRS